MKNAMTRNAILPMLATQLIKMLYENDNSDLDDPNS